MRKISRFDGNVENFKRRRALTPLPGMDLDSRLFFERVINIKKIQELIFITKSNPKSR